MVPLYDVTTVKMPHANAGIVIEYHLFLDVVITYM